MYSPDTIKTNTIENNEVPLSPEVFEQLEISSEDFCSSMDDENKVFKNETTTEIENANNTINLDQESFQKVKEKSNIESELAAIDKEAEIILEEAKSEVADFDLEVKEKTPEEIKESRHTEIAQEIEKEFKKNNGPMYRDLNQKEIEANKQMAKLWGKEWDGSTTQMTEAASEFFFDHKGKGKNSVPDQANKILNERFPEYEANERGVSVEDIVQERKTKALNEINSAIEDRKRIRQMKGGENLGGYEEAQLIKKYTESGLLSQEEIEKNTKEKEVEQQPEIFDQKENSKLEIIESIEQPNTEIVSSLLEKSNIEFKTINLVENSIYTQAFVVNQDRNPKEEIVRLYRGVRNLDSLLEQKSYPFRFEQYQTLSPDDKSKISTAIEKLSINTGYENLKEYIELVSPHLNDSEKNTLNSEIKFIEETILSGSSCRKALHQAQISHPMGSSTFGLSPYLSTSYEAQNTAAETAVMVLDVPVSAMEDWDADSDSESNLKGSFKKEYISAILLDSEKNNRDTEMMKNELINSLNKISEFLPKINTEKSKALRAENHKKILEQDILQASLDKRELELDRINKLFTEFNTPDEIKSYVEKYKEDTSIDIYKYVQNQIYEIYERKHDALSPNLLLKDDTYSNYTKGKVDDEMLFKIKNYVRKMEERSQK